MNKRINRRKRPIPEFNEGIRQENLSQKRLERIFDYVERSPKYSDFYDYLIRLGTLTIFIEVKFARIIFKSGHIVMRWQQFKRLIEARDFLIYLITNKGNIFVTPKQFLSNAHIHHNMLQPKHKNVVMRIFYHEGKGIELIEPEHCQTCEGRVGEWLQSNF